MNLTECEKYKNETNLGDHGKRRHEKKPRSTKIDEVSEIDCGSWNNNVGEKNRISIVGPGFRGKTFLMMNKLPSEEAITPDRKMNFQLDLRINILIMIVEKKYPQLMKIKFLLLFLMIC